MKRCLVSGVGYRLLYNQLFTGRICSQYCVVNERSALLTNYIHRHQITRTLSAVDGNNKMTLNNLNVTCLPDDETLKISFEYSHNGLPARNFNLQRNKNELLGQSLQRLRANMSRFLNKAKKKKKDKNAIENVEDEDTFPISVWKNEIQLSDTTPNVEAWTVGSKLYIGDKEFHVFVNVPAVNKLVIPSSMMVNFPVYIQLNCEFTDITQCKVTWYRMTVKDTEYSGGVKEWQEIATSIVYCPTMADLGHQLKVQCTPQNIERNLVGKTVSTESPSVVNIGPGYCPFETRHLFTKEKTDETSLRVMTYNILADLYSDSDFSREQLYPYCPAYALNIDYRTQLLLKEITGYNADLICLQEVDKKVFERDLLPDLSLFNFEGLLCLKAGQVPEGSATFYNKSKFKLIDQHDIVLSGTIESDSRFNDILKLLECNEQLMHKVLQKQTIQQVSILESLAKPGQLLCVANTHLYFYPSANNVRLIQIAVCMRHLEHVVELYKDKGKSISIIFCGDFNSNPNQGINLFVTTGSIMADFQEWKLNGSTDSLLGMELNHPFSLSSGSGYPIYTNYVGGFNATLDYIFYDNLRFDVTEVVPSPDDSEVVLHTALPSVVFPSDHIAQICTLKWKQ
ncbi:2',5'-phosphodiesterase 12-like [Argonauta hians]